MKSVYIFEAIIYEAPWRKKIPKFADVTQLYIFRSYIFLKL